MSASLDAIANVAALRFVDSIIEGTCVGVFAALLLRFSRRQNAATRFAVAFSALIAIAVLPLIGGWSVGSPSGTGHAAFTLPRSWAAYLFTLWAVIAAWFLIGFARALGHVHSLRKSCFAIDEQSLDPLLRETLNRHRANRPVAFCTSDQVAVPTALGLFKPSIVIPRWVMAELSPAELNQVLLHELAHLRRWDDWTNLIQQLVRAIFFFHPAVWWMERQVALEREMACDDAVLQETASPRAYAECLAHLAEKSFVRRSFALAQAALGRIRHVSLRVAQILDADRNTSGGRTWKPAALLAGFAIVSVVGLSHAPTLVAFQDVVPNHTAEHASATFSPAISIANPVKALNAKLTNATTPAAVVAAKFKTAPRPRTPQASMAANTKRFVKSKAALANMVHEVRGNTFSAPVAHTVFLVIESGAQTGEPVYQIQMWRVTILHVSPERKTPPKQI